MVEMVCFMESLAESETPLEMTELSRGSIRRSMLAMTVKPRSKVDLRVETRSSEEKKPSTPPETRQRVVRRRRRRNMGGEGSVGFGGWRGLWSERSVRRERKKGRDETAMEEEEEEEEERTNLPSILILSLLASS